RHSVLTERGVRLELGMDAWSPTDGKTGLIAERTVLLDDLSKKIDFHPLLVSDELGAEAALKIADAADLDIHLRKSLSTHSGLVLPEMGEFAHFRKLLSSESSLPSPAVSPRSGSGRGSPRRTS